MAEVVCELDGTPAAEEAARRAIVDVKTASISLVGVVRAPRFDVPAPAVGDRIRRFQRVESQLLRLTREAKGAGLHVTVALPGHVPAPVREHEVEQRAA